MRSLRALLRGSLRVAFLEKPGAKQACIRYNRRAMSKRKLAIRIGAFAFLLALQALVLPAQAPSAGKGDGHGPVAEASEKLAVVSDLGQRLAMFRPVKMPFDSAGLTAREKQLVEKLVEASHYIEDIYWRQSDPEGLALYRSLEGSENPADQKLRRFLRVNGSRFDLIDDNKSFAGTEPIAPGRGYYPKGLTREEIEQYVKEHPEKKAEIYSPYTVVERKDGQLVGVPYHVAYREFLEPAAKELREAAALSDDPAFARFLQLRADALLTDDYYSSDFAWLDLKNPKFDIIFAPYDVYLDDLLGVKAQYGAAVLLRDEKESQKLALFQKYVPDLQDALPLPAEDRPSKKGHATPMEVMDSPFRAGDLRHGYQAVADTLPDDPRIVDKKGTKKIFFKNYMDARVKYIVLPIAQRLMRPDQAALASGEGYLSFVMMHEISHGLGPIFARTPGGKMSINEAIGPAYSPLEEAKADVVGVNGLGWLVGHEALPKERLEGYYASYVAGIFRTVRFGIAEAHGAAQMMEFNYLSEQGAIRWDAAAGKYAIDYARMPTAIAALAKELLEMEATGDRARVEKWFQKYGAMPDTLKSALSKASDIPVDIDPIFSFPEPIR